MAAFNFPNSPSTNDLHTENSVTWKWNGSVWKRQGVAGAQGAQGHQGRQGAAGAAGAQGAAGSATISNNADNRVITGGSGTNLNGEATLTYDGTFLTATSNNFVFKGIDTNASNAESFIQLNAGKIFYHSDENNAVSGSGHYFNVDGSEKLRIDAGGKILLGTTTAGQTGEADALTVYQSGHTGITIRTGGTSNNTAIYFADGTSGDQNYRGAITYTHSGDNLIFKTAGSNERLRIDSSGRVGIKFTGNHTMNSSSTNLVIGDGGSGVGMTFWTASGADNQTISFQTNESLSRAEGEIKYGPTGTSVTNDRNAMMFRTNSGERLRITSGGSVNINDTSNTSIKLYVTDTSPVIGSFHKSDGGTNDQARISLGALSSNPPYQRGVNLIGENNGAGHDFVVATSPSHSLGPTEKLRVKSNGNTGIGNNAPAATLHIGGVATTSPEVRMQRTASYDNTWKFYQSHYGSGDHGTLFIQPTLATKPNLEIVNSAGNMGMRVDPDTGIISVPSGGGIDFSATSNSNATTASEHFDDYEEGSWTPVASKYSGGAISCSYNSQDGHYIKIGRMVYVQFNINIASVSSQGSNINYIDGLPYVPDTAYRASGHALWNNAIDVDHISGLMVHSDFGGCIYTKQATTGTAIANFSWKSGSLSGSISYRAN